MKIRLSALAQGVAVACSSGLPVWAQEHVAPVVTVTATRTAQTADDAIQSVTVVTREEIERSVARDLAGLLDEYAGLNVSRDGGAGKSTGVFLRGTDSRHVLVLVDGIRAASATLGSYDWNALSPEQIERIEIVRGPRASLYGSDAVGGVIQIFTRRAAGAEASVMVGSQSKRRVRAAYGGGEDWKYSVEAGRETTDGTRTFSTDSTSYGFERKHAGFSLEGAIAPGLTAVLRANQAWGENELDPFTGNNDYLSRTLSLKLAHRISDNWSQSLTLGQHVDESESFSPYVPSTIETDRKSLAWQHDLTVLSGVLSVGFDYWNDHVTKDRSGVIDQAIDNSGLFAQYQFEALGSDWQLGARTDRHDTFGDHSTWNAGWGRNLGGGFRMTASYGTAFKAPTVNSLFWPYSNMPSSYSYSGMYFTDTFIMEGNPALRPERSKSGEVGLSYRHQNLALGVNAYHTRLRNLIDWTYDFLPTGGAGTFADPYTATYNYYPKNIASARIRGLELTAATKFVGWTLEAAFTRLIAENLDSGLQLDRRPGKSAVVKASREFGAQRLRFELEGHDERLDASGTRRIPGYGLVHVGYDYAVSKDLSVGVRVENLLDKEYSTSRTSSRFYEAPGRSGFVTLRYAMR